MNPTVIEIVQQYQAGNVSAEEALGALQRSGYWAQVLMQVISDDKSALDEALDNRVRSLERDVHVLIGRTTGIPTLPFKIVQPAQDSAPTSEDDARNAASLAVDPTLPAA